MDEYGAIAAAGPSVGIVAGFERAKECGVMLHVIANALTGRGAPDLVDLIAQVARIETRTDSERTGRTDITVIAHVNLLEVKIFVVVEVFCPADYRSTETRTAAIPVEAQRTIFVTAVTQADCPSNVRVRDFGARTEYASNAQGQNEYGCEPRP